VLFLALTRTITATSGVDFTPWVLRDVGNRAIPKKKIRVVLIFINVNEEFVGSGWLYKSLGLEWHGYLCCLLSKVDNCCHYTLHSS
jgi:hypothetical protein